MNRVNQIISISHLQINTLLQKQIIQMQIIHPYSSYPTRLIYHNITITTSNLLYQTHIYIISWLLTDPSPLPNTIPPTSSKAQTQDHSTQTSSFKSQNSSAKTQKPIAFLSTTANKSKTNSNNGINLYLGLNPTTQSKPTPLNPL